MTLRFPFLERQATYIMTELRRHRSKERTKPVCFTTGTLPGSSCPRLLQCQVSLTQGESFPSPNHTPVPPQALLSPAAARLGGHRLSRRTPIAHVKLAALGRALMSWELRDINLSIVFLQCRSSKRI